MGNTVKDKTLPQKRTMGELIVEFKGYVKEEMSRKEIQQRLGYYHPCFVDQLSELCQVRLKR